jgi:hypothetical protein
MKLVSLTVLGAAAALSGCGTTAPSAAARSDPSDDTDYATVNAINNVARSRGVQVFWFRYPQKAAKSTSPASGNGGGAS